MNINPFIDLISQIISLYNFVLIVSIIVNWLIYFDIINRYQPLVQRITILLQKLVEPPLEFIRRYIPPVAGLDLSVIIFLLGLNFLRNLLYTYFYKF